MTSNIGSQDILEAAGSGDWEGVEETVRREMHVHFRPEFLNRVDDVVVFRPLSREDLARIVELQLGRVARLAGELGVRLEVTPAARAFLAEEGYDPAFGARPLKRVIQRQVQDPLALRLLEEDVPEGSVVRVEVAPEVGALTFLVTSPGAGAEGSNSAFPEAGS
jgi:ATP-dependent Clp protease ATP-binding subunit ClpB